MQYLIPDTQSQEESLEALYHKIKDDPFDDLISSVELAVHLKKKSFNELEKYFDFVLEEEENKLMKLKIFENEINENNLIDYYLNPTNYKFKEIDIDIDLDKIKKIIVSFEFNNKDNRKRTNRSKTDAIISPIIHQSLKDIPKHYVR